jgi:hypothetical protein
MSAFQFEENLKPRMSSILNISILCVSEAYSGQQVDFEVHTTGEFVGI